MDYIEKIMDDNEKRKRRFLKYSKKMDQMTKDKMSVVVKKMIEIRKLKGMSQQDIADVSGIAAPNIARIESCKNIPTIQVLSRYAGAMGMSINIDVVPEKE